jgi:hypothetical protein
MGAVKLSQISSLSQLPMLHFTWKTIARTFRELAKNPVHKSHHIKECLDTHECLQHFFFFQA